MGAGREEAMDSFRRSERGGGEAEGGERDVYKRGNKERRMEKREDDEEVGEGGLGGGGRQTEREGDG